VVVVAVAPLGAAVTKASRSPDVPDKNLPVGACLMSSWNKWNEIGADFWTIRTLKRGLRWNFSSFPSLTTTPIPFFIVNQEKRKLVSEHIREMLEKGAIEPVRNPNTPGFYSRIFLTPKKNGQLRPIIDLSSLNTHIIAPRFKMESAQTVRSVLTKGQWAISVDLQDAYFHVPIRPSMRKYLRFQFEGSTWQFTSLPFGISVAPWAFTRVMSVLAAYLHRKGMFIHMYIDDWLLRGYSRDHLVEQVPALLDLMRRLGLRINLKKSVLTPTQNLVFLGYRYNLATGMVYPTQEAVDKLVQKVKALRCKSSAPAIQWLSLIGVIGSIDSLIPLGRIYLRPIQMWLLSHWKWNDRDPNIMQRHVPVPYQLIGILNWWVNHQRWNLGVFLRHFRAEYHLFTDASINGWGSHLGSLTANGTWSQSEAKLHINVLETRAILRALKSFQPVLQGKSVLVSTDNSTTLSYINKQGGTKSFQMLEATSELLIWCHTNAILLQANHIKGSLNVMADQLSRSHQVIETEWSLHPTVANLIWEEFFVPQIDLFATRFNNKLTKFVMVNTRYPVYPP
jgi:hypothetical protein